MKNIITLFFLLVIASCSSLTEWSHDTFEPKGPYDEVHTFHQPLQGQRLIPRPGYEGHLTNRVCKDFYGKKCDKDKDGNLEVSIRQYDIRDEALRKKLIEFGFACSVGGKRYRICPDRPGFCRRELHKKCVKWKKGLFSRKKKKCKKWDEKIVKKYIDAVKDYEFLLDGATECKKGM